MVTTSSVLGSGSWLMLFAGITTRTFCIVGMSPIMLVKLATYMVSTVHTIFGEAGAHSAIGVIMGSTMCMGFIVRIYVFIGPKGASTLELLTVDEKEKNLNCRPVS